MKSSSLPPPSNRTNSVLNHHQNHISENDNSDSTQSNKIIPIMRKSNKTSKQQRPKSSVVGHSGPLQIDSDCKIDHQPNSKGQDKKTGESK